MTTLVEDMKEAIRGLWRSMGFEASAGTAAAVVPAVVLGIVLNAIALNAVDSVRPIKVKKQIVCLALVELQSVQTLVFSTLRQIEDSGRSSCRRVEWQKCA
jgi:hypothetical protein